MNHVFKNIKYDSSVMFEKTTFARTGLETGLLITAKGHRRNTQNI